MLNIRFQRRRIEIKVNNIVATASVGFRINLERFAKLNNFDIDEQFPQGVHCKSKEIIGLVTLFKSGKMISAGTKSLKDAKHNIQFICGLIEKQKDKVALDLILN